MEVRSSRGFSCSLIWALWALVSCASPQHAASQALRSEAGAYELEVLVDGQPARAFVHAGETHILGQEGSRYVLRIHNRSGRRVEAVVSVDGLDVIDGKAGDFANKRGYLVSAHDYVDIDGWRLSNREAAAFRFSPIGASYAARTGSARNVGVIGVAVFSERIVRAPRPVVQGEPVQGEPSRWASSMPAPSAAAPSAPASEATGANEARADSAPAKKGMSRSRSGLGTEFGEAVHSEIHQVEFVRAHPSRPSAFLGARYNDREGLYALGIDVDGYDQPSDLALRQSADPFPSAHGFARPPADWRRH
ncbi:MAG: hypothetical protein JWN48_2128 [Myxococcaceae bacterium]|nr:hypothetical protein [Myxococcaceae bacterium]